MYRHGLQKLVTIVRPNFVKLFLRDESTPIVAAQLIGVVVTLAWLQPRVAEALLPTGWQVMTLSTSISIIAVGFALVLSNSRNAVCSLGQLIALITTAMLIFISLINHYTADLIAYEDLSRFKRVTPMSLQTIFGLTLIATFSVLNRFKEQSKLPDYLIVVSAIYCLVLAFGYFYADQYLIGQTRVIRTSEHTLASLILLTLGGVWIRGNKNFGNGSIQDGPIHRATNRLQNLIDALHRFFGRLLNT